MKQSQRIYFPLAVYEATFADGSKARLSFGRRLKDGSPDADQGRRFVELLYCRESIGPAPAPFKILVDAEGQRAHWSGTKDEDAYPFTIVPALSHIDRKPGIVDGWIEFKGQRTRDPHFEEGKTVSGRATVLPSVSRVTPKQALRELLAALSDPTVTPEALRPVFEQARRLAA
jgi:hypothetical protein